MPQIEMENKATVEVKQLAPGKSIPDDIDGVKPMMLQMQCPPDAFWQKMTHVIAIFFSVYMANEGLEKIHDKAQGKKLLIHVGKDRSLLTDDNGDSSFFSAFTIASFQNKEMLKQMTKELNIDEDTDLFIDLAVKKIAKQPTKFIKLNLPSEKGMYIPVTFFQALVGELSAMVEYLKGNLDYVMKNGQANAVYQGVVYPPAKTSKEHYAFPWEQLASQQKTEDNVLKLVKATCELMNATFTVINNPVSRFNV